MLTKRIICCLDVKDGRVVKGVSFKDLRDAGDPVELAARYDEQGVDELVFLDISATLDGRRALTHMVEKAAEVLAIPFTVGGGVKTLEDAKLLIQAGADKVSVNSAAVANPDLLTQLAEEFGSQAVVLAIDAKSVADNKWSVWTHSGTHDRSLDVIEWAQLGQENGAGEILLTSMDRDGSKQGFDCLLTKAVSDATSVPVIASGGAGNAHHFVEVLGNGADAALGASVFHYGEMTIADVKECVKNAGMPVRITS